MRRRPRGRFGPAVAPARGTRGGAVGRRPGPRLSLSLPFLFPQRTLFPLFFFFSRLVAFMTDTCFMVSASHEHEARLAPRTLIEDLGIVCK